MTGPDPFGPAPADDLLERVDALLLSSEATDPDLGQRLARTDDPLLLCEAGLLLEGVTAARVSRAAPRRTAPLRIAVAATFTADGVVPLLRTALLASGLDAEIHLCPYDRLGDQLTDPASALAAFRPEVTLCLRDSGSLLPVDWDPSGLDGVRDALVEQAAAAGAAAAAFAERTGSAVLLHTVPLPRADRDSVIGYRSRAALGRIWREANTVLLRAGEEHAGVYAFDLEAALADAPGPLRDERRYRFGRMAWTPHVELVCAREAAAFARAVTGLGRKVLVLDLDNTLWGGVVGDDGPAGIELGSMYPGDCYTDLQRRALALRRQGVLLAVCTKNDAGMVDQVLAGHPDMVLRPDDFVAVLADWQPKDTRIAALAEELSLGLDAFAFADDSAFECGLVRGSLPQVDVVHLDGDPAGHSSKVLDPARFAQLGTTATDTERTTLYRRRRARRRFGDAQGSVDEYLRGLGIQVLVGPADEFTLPRLVQLEGRTNQFNMTGTAHGEGLSRRMAGSADHAVLTVEVTDRFGAEGVVGGVWLDRGTERWTVRNMVLSCRVLSRGVERAVLQYVADRARAEGAVLLEADFTPTDRNGPGASFYPEAGLSCRDRNSDGNVTLRYLARLDELPALTPDWITLAPKEALDHA
ncbi:HAD-IIIC family phosphatase [Streptomyces sp. NBC_00385]|uniref:HAD-IIIC family phosphatase n=1 Tax=Streptomyces sp. NBC_00385 TaxID=2975733 RepID=UPI002DDB46D4|nr:HAD-IIIC family phosphatase [Streptomyces sp. NBC_00385]WRZ08191.1 HAD-IIIC family phosphatase [Streptomyces sp. NBC_00385]